MTGVYRYKKCPTCGRVVGLTKWARFRKHKGQWPIEAAERPECPMSGEVA